MKKFLFIALITLFAAELNAAANLTVTSPDGRISCEFSSDASGIDCSVAYDGKTLFRSENLSITAADRRIGANASFSSVKRTKADALVPSPFYRAKEIKDVYNGATFKVDKDWSMAVRVYDDGMAYRWIYEGRRPIKVNAEEVNYDFKASDIATAPYVRDGAGEIERQYMNCFENTYVQRSLETLDQYRLIVLPMVVESVDGIKVGLTESALESYPGLYLKGTGGSTLQGFFAPYPKTEVQGGHNNLEMIVTEREDFIALLDGKRALPWRIAVIAPDDVVLAETNLSYLLGEPSRVADTSWIKPGKVAWDWWNDWNIGGVDFESGVNNDTYKVYIDFAAKNGIEYVILDEGWAVNLKADLMQVVPEIDVKELVDYAAERGVGIILWAGYYAFERDMENVCRHYADMGVKGFKVDFMNRDDQKMTDFLYRAGKTAASHGLILDMHGTHKPAGLNRTYPNVLNFEGVNGMEQLKWSPDTLDMMEYDVQIPYLRQMSGPMDYTQGAMINAARGNYRPSNSEPMGQGTRTHQLALYMVFDSPISMLCDSPTNYEREPESVAFIADVPTVWDETRILSGEMGEYIVTARRKGSDWWVGGITDWNPRDIEVDFSFLGPGQYEATVFEDGANAHRLGRDYKKSSRKIDASSRLKFHLAPGGGVALKIAAAR